MMFFAPDEGGGEGSGGEGEGAEPSKGAAAFTPPAKSGTGDHEPPAPKAGSGTDGAGTGEGDGEPTAPAGGFDASKFAKEFGDVIGTHLKEAAPKPVAKELTPEEAKKLLNVWEPDDAWYAEYDNLETRKTAVAKMRDGLVRQSDTIAQMRMQELISALKEELSPQLSAVQEMAEQQRNERMGKAYPDLAKPELNPLVNAVAQDLVKNGKKFNSESELFKALASGVEAVIKVNNPEFKLTTGSTPAGQQSRGGRQIPTTTPGAGGSSGRSTTPTTSKPRGIAVFDK